VTYYALLDKKGRTKSVYGDKKSSKSGYEAKLDIGSDGDYFSLVENALYHGTLPDSGKKTSNHAHDKVIGWDYYVKTIKSDGEYYDVLINVRDTGKNQFVYGVTLKNKQDSQATATLKTSRIDQGNPVHGDSISQNGSNGNIKNQLKNISEPNYAAAIQENKKLREANEYLKNQFEITKVIKPKPQDINHIANKLLKKYGSTYDKSVLSDNLTKLFDYIHNSEQIDGAEVAEVTASIAKAVLQESKQVDTSIAEYYSDLKESVRKTKISISDQDKADLEAYGGYNDFRKHYFGKINLGNEGLSVDSYYEELAGQYPELFDTEITHPADRLIAIADVIDSLKPAYVNPFGANMDEMASLVAGEIFDDYFSIKPESPTFADKKAAEILKTKVEYRHRMYDMKQDLKAKYDKRLLEVKKKNVEKIQKLTEKYNAAQGEQKEYYKNQIKKLREFKNERLFAQQQRYQEWILKERTRRADSIDRSKLLKLARKLSKMKTDPSIKARIDDLIGDLDLTAKGMTNKNRLNLEDLRAKYNNLKETDPDFIANKGIEEKLSRLDKKQISDLSVEEVKALIDSMLQLCHGIEITNSLINRDYKGTINDYSEEVMGEVRRAAGLKNTIFGSGADKINSLMLNPVREFRRLAGYQKDSRLEAIAHELNEGQRKMIQFQMESSKMFDEVVSDKKIAQTLQGKHAEKIRFLIDGETIYITPAMRISLYLHSLNNDNLLHMKYGGVTIPDWNYYIKGDLANAYAKGKVVKMPPSKLKEILGTMTDKEKQFAEVSRTFLNGPCKDAINETSLALDGNEKATVEEYYGIKTDRNFTRTEFQSLFKDGTIEGMGIFKDRVAAAKNPIMLEDVTSVISRQIDDVSRYYGLAIPVRNFNRIYNYTRKGYTTSVKKVIAEKWGKNAIQYIENFMADIQNGRHNGRNFLDTVRGNFAKATLSVNIGVTMKQAASYPTAAATLGWEPLLKALVAGGKKHLPISRADIELINKYTPLLWYRNQGNSTQELGDIAKNTTWDKKLPWLMGWIQKVDTATVGRLWYAAEYYVKDNFKALVPGSDAYYKKVAEMFNECVEETQPNYTVMQRPDILRSTNQLTKALTMFSTQRFQNYGIIYDSYGNLRAKSIKYHRSKTAENMEQLKAARMEFAKAISSQLVATVVLISMSAIANAILHKMDDYKEDTGKFSLESVSDKLAEDMLETMAGNILWGSELYDILRPWVTGKKGYGIEVTGISVLNDVAGSFSKFESAWTSDKTGSEKQAEIEKAAIDLSKQLSVMFGGVPVKNIEKIIKGIQLHTEDYINGEFGTFNASDKQTNSETYKSMYVALTQDGNQDRYTRLYNGLIENGVDTDTINQGISKQLRNHELVLAAAQAKSENDLTTYEQCINELKNLGFKFNKQIKPAINYCMDHMNELEGEAEVSGEKITESYFEEADDEESIYDYDMLFDALIEKGGEVQGI